MVGGCLWFILPSLMTTLNSCLRRIVVAPIWWSSRRAGLTSSVSKSWRVLLKPPGRRADAVLNFALLPAALHQKLRNKRLACAQVAVPTGNLVLNSVLTARLGRIT